MSQVKTAGVKKTSGQCVYSYNVPKTWPSLYNRQSFIITNNPANSTGRCMEDKKHSAAHSYEMDSSTSTLVITLRNYSKCEKLYYTTRGTGRVT